MNQAVCWAMSPQRGSTSTCRSRCEHVLSLAPSSPDEEQDFSWIENLQDRIQHASHEPQCDEDECRNDKDESGTYEKDRNGGLWLCLHFHCGRIFCGSRPYDHIRAHFSETSSNGSAVPHCLSLNIDTLRVWCYRCDSEVYIDNNEPPFPVAISTPLPSFQDIPDVKASSGNDDDSSDQDEERVRAAPLGLTGLRNVGNTCFLNATLQALSNLPPLLAYFSDCRALIPPHAQLSRSFSRLLAQLWHPQRYSSVVPSAVLHALRASHPQFRGFQQHDSQEVLRCLMDALHTELCIAVPDLRSAVSAMINVDNEGAGDDFLQESVVGESISDSSSVDGDEGGDGDCNDDDDDDSNVDGNDDSVNHNNDEEDTYETADSGVSDRGSLDCGFDDEGFVQRENRASSPSAASYSSQRPRQRLLSDDVSMMNCRGDSASAPVRLYLYTSIVSQLFDGRLVSSVRCLSCGRVSNTRETFQDLSLPLPASDQLYQLRHSAHSAAATASAGSDWFSWWWGLWSGVVSWWSGPVVSLYDCLDLFFSSDELKGDNMYSCGACQKLRNGIKYSRVLQLPEVMTIHLKRFRHDFFSSSKVSARVTFPLTGLQMRNYTHAQVGHVTTYDLAAVVCHHGTVGAGHYTTLALNQCDDNWYEYDDMYVTEVSPEMVANCQPYVLFYRKSCSAARQRRVHTTEIMSRSASCYSLVSYLVSRRWISRFNTFCEPGPIDNWDVFCEHGGVRPDLCVPLTSACVRVSLDVWQYLHGSFGGGPVSHQLIRCATCDTAWRTTVSRRRRELAMFRRYQQLTNSDSCYALAGSWFRRWDSFTSGRLLELPGRIDNTHISTQQQLSATAMLRQGSDHVKVCAELWSYFVSVYGGGPEILIFHRPHQSPSQHRQTNSVSASTSVCTSWTDTTSAIYTASENNSATGEIV